MASLKGARGLLSLALASLFTTACSTLDAGPIQQPPVDGWVVFTSESNRPTGSILTLDAAGDEVRRTPHHLQDVGMISAQPDALVLWGQLDNNYAVVHRNGAIESGHTLDRSGYSGHTALDVQRGRLVAVVNGGFGPDGYMSVPVTQELSGANASRGLVAMYVTSLVAEGEGLIFAGSKDDGSTTRSMLARYAPASDQLVQQVVEPRYSECSMTVRIADALFQACNQAGDPGFERILRKVDAATFAEIEAITLADPIRAITATPSGDLIVACDTKIETFSADLLRRSSQAVPPSGQLTIADFQSAYRIADSWYLILKAPRLDVGEQTTHLATALVVDTRSSQIVKTLKLELRQTGEMGTVTVVPASWFDARSEP